MTDQELQELRAHKWRLDGNAVQTIEQARAFLNDVGFCLRYPQRSVPLVPTFIGAYAGSGQNLPDSKHAFADPRAQQATELMVRMLREHSAYELPVGDDILIVSASLFPFFYSLLSDHSPKAPPKLRAQGVKVSPLSVQVFDAIQNRGPLSKEKLRELVGRELSNAALDRSLGELWSILKITRVNYREGEGALWDVLYRWAPEVVKEAFDFSEPEAISGLLGKYLDAVIAATQEEVEQFFSLFTARSKVREAMNALLTARQLSMVSIGPKTLMRVAPVNEPQRRRIHG
ncbi:MAG TPA: crosslink repair DNA glycosylase YcaQ family protein [Candidatus Limnocylindrales bacterium]|nr:crosslink repair DNA glycosylase YcaQ family protein [Candidatus Limnocylindrales bacterium]